MSGNPVEEPRVGNLTVVLSDYDVSNIKLVNGEGRELLSVEFDRTAEAKPRLSVSVLKDGELQSVSYVFDVDA